MSGNRYQETGVREQESLNSYLLTLTSPEELLDKIKELKSEGKEIQEVYTPFYVHGLAEALGLKRTRLGKATFSIRTHWFVFWVLAYLFHNDKRLAYGYWWKA